MAHKDIFIATGFIYPHTLFLNGLQQNSLILYDLFESIGYRCHCIVEGQELVPNLVPGYRFIVPEQILRDSTYRPVFHIEIGLSLDPGWRQYMRSRGAKTIKLYLGNILNIDTETVLHTPGLHFPHHIRGNLDALWTSPHYRTNCAYATALHSTPCRVVPYVWRPSFVSLSPKPLKPGFKPSGNIVIAEPNISFQKNCIVPLLLAEELARQWPEWKGKVYIQNSQRLAVTPFFRDTLLKGLRLEQEGRIVLEKRKSILDLVQEHTGALFICHQFTNDLNYMVLELMWLGVPVLHNSDTWAAYGYSYSIDEWQKAVLKVKTILEGFHNQEWYAEQATLISDVVSPEKVKSEWTAILQSKP